MEKSVTIVKNQQANINNNVVNANMNTTTTVSPTVPDNPTQPAPINTGPCFSLFFNLTISQLFSSAISTIIEFLRVITTNFLIKYLLKESFVKKYGTYIQPVVQATFLLIVAIIIFFIYDYLRSNQELCSTEGLWKIFSVGILSMIFLVLFVMSVIGFYKLYKKCKIQNKIENYY